MDVLNKLTIKEQNPPFGRIFLTDIPEEWRIRKCERSEHFRYIKLILDIL